MLYSKANLEVVRVASKDAFDRGLNGVQLEEDGSTVGFNGKVLMAVGPMVKHIPLPEVGVEVEPGRGGVNVPIDLIEDAKKNLPRDARLQYAVMTEGVGDGKIELTSADRKKTKRVALWPNKEQFPDWKGVLQKLQSGGVDGGGEVRVCVSRKNLIELLTAMEAACPDKSGESPVFITVGSGGGGLVLRAENRLTGQRVVGAASAYNTKGNWLECDKWEDSLRRGKGGKRGG